MLLQLFRWGESLTFRVLIVSDFSFLTNWVGSLFFSFFGLSFFLVLVIFTTYMVWIFDFHFAFFFLFGLRTYVLFHFFFSFFLRLFVLVEFSYILLFIAISKAQSWRFALACRWMSVPSFVISLLGDLLSLLPSWWRNGWVAFLHRCIVLNSSTLMSRWHSLARLINLILIGRKNAASMTWKMWKWFQPTAPLLQAIVMLNLIIVD